MSLGNRKDTYYFSYLIADNNQSVSFLTKPLHQMKRRFSVAFLVQIETKGFKYYLKIHRLIEIRNTRYSFFFSAFDLKKKSLAAI